MDNKFYSFQEKNQLHRLAPIEAQEMIKNYQNFI